MKSRRFILGSPFAWLVTLNGFVFAVLIFKDYRTGAVSVPQSITKLVRWVALDLAIRSTTVTCKT
jgi:hypothetical protein